MFGVFITEMGVFNPFHIVLGLGDYARFVAVETDWFLEHCRVYVL